MTFVWRRSTGSARRWQKTSMTTAIRATNIGDLTGGRVLNLPNLLTISRIFVIPIVVALFYWDSTATRWVACVLFSAAGVTDFFDGYLARRAKQVSRFGRFL